jgi:transglutaminase-like putative cysteine protease
MTFLTTNRDYSGGGPVAASRRRFVSKLRLRHHSETRWKSPGAEKAANSNFVRITVDHLTEYQYERAVSFGEHSLFLRPRESQTIHVEFFELDTVPEGRLRWVRDCFNNVVAVVNFGTRESARLSFRCRMRFAVAEENPFDFILETRAAEFPFSYDEREKSALAPYLESEESERWPILDWARQNLGDPSKPRETISLLTDLNLAIHRSFGYERRDDEGTQSANETLECGRGSCRDLAQLFVATSRQLGLAARFVSGYLYEPVMPDGTAASNVAAGSMHAWAEVYLPGAGWRGFDPTNGLLADHHFLPAAVANVPDWVSPIQGRYFHSESVPSKMHVTLRIEAT